MGLINLVVPPTVTSLSNSRDANHMPTWFPHTIQILSEKQLAQKPTAHVARVFDHGDNSFQLNEQSFGFYVWRLFFSRKTIFAPVSNFRLRECLVANMAALIVVLSVVGSILLTPFLMILVSIIFLASIGKSLGVRRLYIKLLLMIFEVSSSVNFLFDVHLSDTWWLIRWGYTYIFKFLVTFVSDGIFLKTVPKRLFFERFVEISNFLDCCNKRMSWLFQLVFNRKYMYIWISNILNFRIVPFTSNFTIEAKTCKHSLQINICWSFNFQCSNLSWI